MLLGVHSNNLGKSDIRRVYIQEQSREKERERNTSLTHKYREFDEENCQREKEEIAYERCIYIYMYEIKLSITCFTSTLSECQHHKNCL